MAKDYKRKCPNCYGIDLGDISLIMEKGDGNCFNCHGEGVVYGIQDGLAAMVTGGKEYHTCEICSGTGQCQTCGGTGFEYYNEEQPPKQEKKHYNNSDYSSGIEHSNYKSANTKKSNGNSIFLQIIRFIVAILIIIELLNYFGTANKNGSKQHGTNYENNTVNSDNDSRQSTNEPPPPLGPIIRERTITVHYSQEWKFIRPFENFSPKATTFQFYFIGATQPYLVYSGGSERERASYGNKNEDIAEKIKPDVSTYNGLYFKSAGNWPNGTLKIKIIER